MKQQTKKMFAALLLWLPAAITANASDTVTYVYTDPQGTPLAEADAKGNITATFDYTPYGTNVQGNPSNGPGYTGHVSDPETSLIYMKARYYDPVTGSFLSIDPLGPTPGNVAYFNRFSYVGNNPISRIDPSGKYFCDSKGGCDDFDKAYAKLKGAAGAYSSHSAEGQAFAKVLGYYGEKNAKNNDGRSIYVEQGTTSTGNPAEIGHNPVTGSDTIRFDFKQIKENSSVPLVEMAASVGHEGVHGVDDAARRKAGKWENEDTVRNTERNAYRLQSYVNQGLGVNSSYGLWRSDWPAGEVEGKRDAAIEKYSEQSVQDWLKE